MDDESAKFPFSKRKFQILSFFGGLFLNLNSIQLMLYKQNSVKVYVFRIMLNCFCELYGGVHISPFMSPRIIRKRLQLAVNLVCDLGGYIFRDRLIAPGITRKSKSTHTAAAAAFRLI